MAELRALLLDLGHGEPRPLRPLRGPPDPQAFAFDADQYAPDELTLGDRVAYLHLPGGLGRSRLAAALTKRHGDVDVTMRNWRTVARLRDMVTGAGGRP